MTTPDVTVALITEIAALNKQIAELTKTLNSKVRKLTIVGEVHIGDTVTAKCSTGEETGVVEKTASLDSFVFRDKYDCAHIARIGYITALTRATVEAEK